MNQVIKKPWGHETILTPANSVYTAKFLQIKAGQRLSLQYHDQKTETLVLVSGQANITLDKKTEAMKPLLGYTITPPTIHRVEAVTDCQIFEASTPEQGTTYRLQDDFNRPNETPDIRNSSNRGWQND